MGQNIRDGVFDLLKQKVESETAGAQRQRVLDEGQSLG